MGYCTYYQLAIECDEGKFNALDVIANLRSDYEQAEDALSETGGYSSGDPRWYEHEKDMSAFSEKYPDILFILSGEGESFEDTWKYYFKNGKRKKMYARVKFPHPHFRPEKLEDCHIGNEFQFESDVDYDFSLELNDGSEIDYEYSLRVIKDLRESYDGAKSVLSKFGEFNSDKEWIDCDANLLEFSKKYPKNLFIIGCVSPDEDASRDSFETLWRKYFNNGKLQLGRAFWYFNEFNISMLK